MEEKDFGKTSTLTFEVDDLFDSMKLSMDLRLGQSVFLRSTENLIDQVFLNLTLSR